MEKGEMRRRPAADILVMIPGLYGLAVTCYFTFLTGTVPLSRVFPWFFYLWFPAVIIAMFFLVLSLYHLLGKRSGASCMEKISWIVSFILFTGIALPLYRFTVMGGKSQASVLLGPETEEHRNSV